MIERTPDGRPLKRHPRFGLHAQRADGVWEPYMPEAELLERLRNRPPRPVSSVWSVWDHTRR